MGKAFEITCQDRTTRRYQGWDFHLDNVALESMIILASVLIKPDGMTLGIRSNGTNSTMK